MIVLALSGGVDSAVAVQLLLQQGSAVHGLFMKHPYQAEDETDARKLADFFGIPLEVLDIGEAFEEIVRSFTDEYFRGRTPNPCVLCNRTIKFGLLAEHAFSRLGAEGFATGHYVRRKTAEGISRLYRAVDPSKDQSYVLYGIDRRLLPRLHFPLGELTKDRVRDVAREIGLPVSEKKESQDICFVPNGRHGAFLKTRCPDAETSGFFVSTGGTPLAPHSGFEQFTVGQRKGMGVGFGRRVFVLDIDARSKNVVIGDREESAFRILEVSDLRWLLPEDPVEALEAEVKIRYRTPASPARITPLGDGRARIEFEQTQYGAAPGQSAVFYRNDRLLGGGIIESSRGEPPVAPAP